MTRFIIPTLLLLSCSGKEKRYAEKIQNTEKIRITFRTDFLVEAMIDVDEKFLDTFKIVLNQTAQKCSCQSSGKINFYSKDSVILEATFATTGTGSGADCQFLMVSEEGKEKCFQLNYRAGRYLDETYNDLIK